MPGNCFDAWMKNLLALSGTHVRYLTPGVTIPGNFLSRYQALIFST